MVELGVRGRLVGLRLRRKSEKEDMRSEARRGEQGQSGGRRKRFAPQVSHALQEAALDCR